MSSIASGSGGGSSGSGRNSTTLLANRTYYVSTMGNDSHDGLTIPKAFLTIQHAINIVQNDLFLNGFQVNIQIEDGTYNEYLLCNFYPSTFPTGTFDADSPIHIMGNAADSTKVILKPTIPFPGIVSEFGVINVTQSPWFFRDFTIDATGCPGPDCDCAFTLNGGRSFFANMIFAGAKGLGTIIDAGSTAVVELTTPIIVNGGTGYLGFLFAIENCTISTIGSGPFTFAIDPLCTGPIFDVELNSVFITAIGGPIFSGAVTGQKFVLRQDSRMYLNDPSINPLSLEAIPGSTPGILDNSCVIQGNVEKLSAVVANTTATIPAGCRILGITIQNTTANAVTGGVNIGTTALGNDVLSAQAVGGNALLTVADASILKHIFSQSASQQLFISAGAAWNSASLTIAIGFLPVIT